VPNSDAVRSGFRSGFCTIVGRPNVGKSTLLNAVLGRKVSIVSDKPQTTRTQVRGVRTTETHQIVFLDTPGVHKPRTLLGERANERALATLDEVDVICFVIDASAPIGPGDRFVAERVSAVETPVVLALNKTDAAGNAEVARHLAEAAAHLGDFAAYVPVSARTGEQVDVLVREIEGRVPSGPHYYPPGTVTDQPEGVIAAELLREQLLAAARDELPHAIAVTTEDVEERATARGEPLLAMRVVVRVERESQKAIVIGKGGARIKAAGTAARLELEALLGVRVHLETRVKVEPGWQRRAAALDRLCL
jgi:GTP-binding protein Era